MSKTLVLVLAVLTLILLVGCSANVPTSIPTQINQPQAQVTLTATATLETSVIITPTAAAPVKTDIPIRDCENSGVPAASNKDLHPFGAVLLLSSDQNKLDTLDLDTQTISPIYYDKNSQLSVFGSSPNENWLAYSVLSHEPNGEISNKFKLELISETGEKIEHQMDVSQFEDLFMGSVFGGFGNSYWINDELIYTTMLVRDRSEYGSKLIDSIPVILNPFTGSWEENLLLSQTGLNRKDEIGFSQDLQKVVLQGREITLKDIKSDNHLWSTDKFYLGIPDSKIRWSPNGDYVAIGKHFPDPIIFLVSADGKHSETIPIGNISGFVNFEWSPNNQYIMIYHSYGDNEKQFYLYDRTKGQLVLKCPVVEPWDVFYQWSPDSNQIIYGIFDGDLKILDIPSGKVAQLENKDVIPLGWTSKSFSQ